MKRLIINNNGENQTFVGTENKILGFNNNGEPTLVEGGASSGFLNVKNLGMTINNGATEATVSFTNPASDSIDKVYLFVSYIEDLVNRNYEYCSTSSNVKLLSNSLSTTNNGTNSYKLTITSDTLNKTAYVRVFVGYGGSDYSSGSGLNQSLSDITPPAVCTNISATQLTIDSVKLTWTKPTDTDLANIIIKSKIDSYPTDNFDGDTIYTGTGNTVALNGLTKGENYYFRFFTQDTSGNVNTNTSQEVNIKLDNTPPIEATSFSVLSGFSICKLKFSDSTSSDWKLTKIIRKVGNEPTSIDDGTLILTNMTKDSYKNSYFIDGGLNNGTEYFYKLYSIDTFGNISSGISQSGTPIASALPEISGFIIENINNGTKQKLSWTNPFAPTGLTYVERQIFCTTDTSVELDTLTRDQCIANASVINLSSGVGSGTGIADTYTTSTTLTIGQIIKYKVFVHYDSSGTAIWSSGTYDIKEVKDETPCEDFTNVSSVGSSNQVTINFQNPSDSDWQKACIFRRMGTYPDGTNTLEKIYESTTQNAGNINTFIDTELTNNTVYYYLLVSYDISGNTNKNTKFTCQPIPLQAYTVEWDSSTDTYIRKDLAEGLSQSDFNNIEPYKSMQRVVINDSKTIQSYLKSTDSTLKQDNTSSVLDGTAGQVMVKLNKFYYKMTKVGTKYTFSIANTLINEYSVFPAFIRNGATVDYIYIGVYQAYQNTSTSKFESRSGIIPTTGLDISTMRTLASARGTNWNCIDFLTLSAIQYLYLIEYASFNSQNTLGNGITNDTTLHPTGESNSIGNASSSGQTDGKHYISYRGVENIFGNGISFIDGIKALDSAYYVANYNFSSFVNSSSTGTYAKIDDITPTTTNGFISDIENTSVFNYGFIGKTLTGADNTYLTDFQYSHTTGNTDIAYINGSLTSGTKSGIYAIEFISEGTNTVSSNMISQGSLDIGTLWKSDDFNRNIIKANNNKSLLSISLVDGTTPSISLSYGLSQVTTRLIVW